MAISICIPTYNRLPSLTRLLDSIYGGFGDYPYEIIVADGGSTDGTLEYLKTLKVTLIKMGGLTGSVKAFNACFKVAKYEYILFAADDFILMPEVIVDACNLMYKYQDIGLVSPKLIEPSRSGNIARTELTFPFLVLSGTHVFRATALREAGYFDENYKTYFIDDDSCLSVLKLGYTIIFTKEVGVIHNKIMDEMRKINNENPGKSSETEYFYGKWRKLNKDLGRRLRWSPIKKYKAILFKHIYERIDMHLTMLKPTKDNFSTPPWCDIFLKQCVAFEAKEYRKLKGFYLAQRLPR